MRSVKLLTSLISITLSASIFASESPSSKKRARSKVETEEKDSDGVEPPQKKRRVSQRIKSKPRATYEGDCRESEDEGEAFKTPPPKSRSLSPTFSDEQRNKIYEPFISPGRTSLYCGICGELLANKDSSNLDAPFKETVTNHPGTPKEYKKLQRPNIDHWGKFLALNFREAAEKDPAYQKLKTQKEKDKFVRQAVGGTVELSNMPLPLFRPTHRHCNVCRTGRKSGLKHTPVRVQKEQVERAEKKAKGDKSEADDDLND